MSNEARGVVGDLIGQQLGPYRIDAWLGGGGMGDVFRGTDTRLQRPVAVKLLHQRDLTAVTSRERFQREARAASALNHPNICVVHDVGDAGGHLFLVMELLQGETLRARLSGGRLPLPTVIEFAIQIADALQAAHAGGIIHRDIKPANIFITSRGQAKLLDFGIAKMFGSNASDDEPTLTAPPILTEGGARIGTAAYMSPEQARGESLDVRSDLFSFGVVLYEMLSGERPFRGSTDAVLFDAILNREPAPLRTAGPDVPGALDGLVARLLEKNRAARVQDAAELLTTLKGIRDGAAAQRAPSRRRPWWPVAAGLVLATAASLYYWSVAGVPAASVHSLAILPFDNQTGEASSEALTGLFDAVISDLAVDRGLDVLPATRTRGYAGSAKTPQDIAGELSADAVLQSVVTRSGDTLRLAASLFAAGRDQAIWSRSFQRPSTELFALEQDVIAGIRAGVGRPGAAATASAVAAAEVDPDAYDFYLRGRSHAGRWNEADLDQAIELLERSTALAPRFAPSQALLGFVYGAMSMNFRPDESQWREKGYAAVEKALAIDPASPDAHFARGVLLWEPSHGFPHRAVLAEYRQSLAGRPNFDEAWHQLGVVLFHVGHLEAGQRAIDRAIALNPGNTQARFRAAPINVYRQRFDDAIAVLKVVPREAYPTTWTYQMAWSLLSLGRLDEASREIEGGLAASAADPGGVLHGARAMLRALQRDRKGAEADIAEAVTRGKGFIHFHHTAYSIGAVYAQFGEYARAQEWIENAANSGFPCYSFFETDPFLARLRETPQFRTFLTKLRQEWQHIPGEQ